MLANPSTDSALAAQSFIDWWKAAGVEYVIEDAPINWLAEKPLPPPVEPARPAIKPVAAAIQPVAAPAPRVKAEWPGTFEALQASLMTDRSLPGNGYGTANALPDGNAGAQTLVISDYPEESELAAGKMGALPLLQNMLRAAGITADNCCFAALAYTRPASGSLRETDKALLREFIHHQIGLIAPKRILLLGTNATRILLGSDLMEARGKLQIINHNVGKMAALATYHPRTLSSQPISKAKAWADLQMFMQEDSA